MQYNEVIGLRGLYALDSDERDIGIGVARARLNLQDESGGEGTVGTADVAQEELGLDWLTGKEPLVKRDLRMSKEQVADGD